MNNLSSEQSKRIVELAKSYAHESYRDSNYGTNHALTELNKLKQYLDSITVKTVENPDA